MKNTSILGILLCITLIPFTSFGQTSSGIIDYTMTMQMQRRNFNNGNANADDNRPSEFTQKRQLTFDNASGKFASSDNRGRGFGSEYISFKDKTYLRAFKRKGNDTTFYTTQPFKEAESFTLTGKSKKILGYNAKEATASLRNGKVTIWFTTDIPVTFSPMNGLVPPDGGLVLDIQNDRMHYQATKIDLKNIDAASVAIPAPSRELSKEEVQKMRSRMGNGRRGDRRPSGNHRRN